MKNFTPFTESLPKQGRWILVTDDVEFLNVFREPENLLLINDWLEYCGKFWKRFPEGKEDEITHWKYAIEEER